MKAMATGMPSAISTSTPRLRRARALVQSMEPLELPAFGARPPGAVQHAAETEGELDGHQREHEWQRPQCPPFRDGEFLDDARARERADDEDARAVPEEKERHGETHGITDELTAPGEAWRQIDEYHVEAHVAPLAQQPGGRERGDQHHGVLGKLDVA